MPQKRAELKSTTPDILLCLKELTIKDAKVSSKVT